MPIEIVTTKTIACKNCGSEAIVKFGTYKGTQACDRPMVIMLMDDFESLLINSLG
jgi:hypothetical protein